MEKMNKEGYSLVELLIAISVSAIVMLAVIGLLGYGSQSMNQTQAKVALQEEAKDSLNHIAAYVQESTDGAWDDTTHANGDLLALMKKKIKNDGNAKVTETVSTEDIYYYWYLPASKTVYFATRKTLLEEQGVPAADLDTDMTTVVDLKNEKKHMLVEHVNNFKAKVIEDTDTKNKTVHITMKLKDDVSQYECERDINMRNQ